MEGSDRKVVHKPAVEDDPQRRRLDITTAKKVLGWSPKVSIEKGLEKTIQYFRKELGRTVNSEKHNGDATEYRGPHTMGPPTFHEPSDNCVNRNKA